MLTLPALTARLRERGTAAAMPLSHPSFIAATPLSLASFSTQSLRRRQQASWLGAAAPVVALHTTSATLQVERR